MPIVYIQPTGEKKLEFWQIYAIGEHVEFVNVPKDWSEDDIKCELEDWCAQWGQEYEGYRFGWNDEEDFGKRVHADAS